MSTYDNWKAHDPASERDDENELCFTEEDMRVNCAIAYARGLAEGRQLGREEATAEIVARLRSVADYEGQPWTQRDLLQRMANNFERADHLRPDKEQDK